MAIISENLFDFITYISVIDKFFMAQKKKPTYETVQLPSEAIIMMDKIIEGQT
ncbi:hypothetical protein [Cuniculiplasma sp. SKW4]|uniref:hypothetical protein n=1 Tax=Cuniculiplasma sp. SKW4 TaxID=3400171 RepID=UPI003FCFFD6C